MKSPELWFTEYQTHGLALSLRAKRTLVHIKSKFQDILVLETDEFGRMLVLDGCIMTTERDEFIYHEMLVHPVMVTHPLPENVLIVGGGDGGTLREVLRYSEVKRAVIVEIDEKVVEVSKEFLPSLAAGFDDPRATLVFLDGADFVQKQAEDSFDIVIIDSTDPVGEAKKLFSEPFYKELKRILRPNGVIVSQSESPILHLKFLKDFHSMLRRIFAHVKLYIAPVPTYPSGLWSFTVVSDREISTEAVRKPPENLKFFNFEVMKGAFALPNFVKNTLVNIEQRQA